MRLLWAFLRRDWHYETTYRGSMVLQIVSIFGAIIVFYAIGLLVGDGASSLQPYGGEYFPFALVGLVVADYFTVGLRAFSQRLRLYQTTGTLEAMFVTTTSGHQTLLLSGVWDFLIVTVRVVIAIAVGIALLDVSFEINPIAAVPLAVLSLMLFIAIGLIAAAVILVIKRGDALTALAGISITILAGVQFPVSVLPEWIRIFAYLFPVYWVLDGLRKSVLTGAAISDVYWNLLIVIVSVCVLIPAAYFIIEWATNRTRRDGSLGHH